MKIGDVFETTAGKFVIDENGFPVEYIEKRKPNFGGKLMKASDLNIGDLFVALIKISHFGTDGDIWGKILPGGEAMIINEDYIVEKVHENHYAKKIKIQKASEAIKKLGSELIDKKIAIVLDVKDVDFEDDVLYRIRVKQDFRDYADVVAIDKNLSWIHNDVDLIVLEDYDV